MPIVNPTNDAPPVEAPSPVRISSPAYKGVTVDTRYEPASALLTNLEGAAWTVNYYSQVLDEDSQSSGQQVNSLAPLQQYRLIKDLELKVTSPLNHSQDLTDAASLVTGAALVYPGLIPNSGDMFLADIGDGKEGVFEITTSEKKSIFRDTAYAIEYKLVSYADEERLGDLKSKTVQILQFVKDFLMHGQNPMVTEDRFAAASRLALHFQRLLPRWVKEFLNTEFMTITIPGQSRPMYDPYLVRAVMAFFNTGECSDLRKVRVLNVDGDPAMNAYSLWDALQSQNRAILRAGFKKTGLVSAKTFPSNPMLESVYFSGIQSLVYPLDPDNTVNLPTDDDLKATEDDNIVATSTDLINLADLIPNLDLDTSDLNPPAIKPVLADDFYVFSQAFYDRTSSGQTLLELSVQRYIDGKALNGKVLEELADTTSVWRPLERFYYIPILLVLIRAYVRSL